jgi:hypothetical protein
MRVVIWLNIILILALVGYSTYCLFKGDFEQALLPYPILILYYLIFARHKIKASSTPETDDSNPSG